MRKRHLFMKKREKLFLFYAKNEKSIYVKERDSHGRKRNPLIYKREIHLSKTEKYVYAKERNLLTWKRKIHSCKRDKSIYIEVKTPLTIEISTELKERNPLSREIRSRKKENSTYV